MLKRKEQPDGCFAPIDGDLKTIARAAALIVESGLLVENRSDTVEKATCCACNRVVRLLYPEIQQMRADQKEIISFILDKEEAETVYLNAAEACDFIGISESTLLRCQRREEIVVAKMYKGKKYFRKRDAERLRREYWQWGD